MSAGLTRVLLIANPAARRGAALFSECVAAFRTAGATVEVAQTERPGHAYELALTRGSDAQALFSLGGDGTAIEVLRAASELGRPVGILPGGTGNLMAQAIGVPRRIRRAVFTLLRGHERAIDLGELDNGRCFGFGAGVGVDVAMLEYATRERKGRYGVLAYVDAAARASLKRRSFGLDLTVDGVTHTFEATAAMVLNFGSVLHGLLPLAPNVDPTDGLLDVCVHTPRSVREVWWAGVRMASRRFSGARRIHLFRAREVTLRATPPERTQADGELLGTTPLTARVLPLAVRVLVPPSRA